MNDDALLLPFAKSLNQFVQGQIAGALQNLGQALPCSVVAVNNTLVTVSFELIGPITFPQVTVPQAISRYARPPTQAGDKGILIASDAYLGGVSGLGGGTAYYGQQPPNLSALVFLPIGNTAFPAVDGNAYNITGPNGAVIQSDNGNSKITLTPTSITLTVGSVSLIINSSGISVEGKDFLSHEHKNVQAGTSNTGGVV